MKRSILDTIINLLSRVIEILNWLALLLTSKDENGIAVNTSGKVVKHALNIVDEGKVDSLGPVDSYRYFLQYDDGKKAHATYVYTTAANDTLPDELARMRENNLQKALPKFKKAIS